MNEELQATIEELSKQVDSPHHPDSELEPESPTLLHWLAEKRPLPATVCTRCQLSVWMRTAEELTGYCRVMHRDTYYSRAALHELIVHCDGALLRERQ